jgi:hypothetical protein
MAPQIEIKQPKLLVVEGADACYFYIWACAAYGVLDVQVMDFGGIKDLTAFLKTLSLLPGYERVAVIAIARDAENNPLSAVSSVKQSLDRASLPVPNEPFEFAGNSPRVAFMIMPGFNGSQSASPALLAGTLEDLLLEIAKDQSTFSCVDLYIDCLQSRGLAITRLHKTKLHAYLSGKNEFCGLKIGEASKAGAWDWQHPRLEKFKAIITTM